MKKTSAYKLLYLLYLLSESEYTKNEIIEIFKASELKITRPLITQYMNQYAKNGIKIKKQINSKRENVYGLEKENINLNFSQEELELIEEIKKILFAQKKYDKIRKTMRLFYKLANYIKNEEEQLEFINFGYYSTINWNLVLQLEKHCEEKNIITIDYILPSQKNKLITIHADELKISSWSQRLYLHGILENSNHFSHLPVDRIYMVKNIISKNNTFNIPNSTFIYGVSKKLYEETYPDTKEKILKTENDKIFIERPIDDIFYIIQRLLYFCPEIYYISDEKIKELLKEKLEMIKTNYDKKRIDK